MFGPNLVEILICVMLGCKLALWLVAMCDHYPGCLLLSNLGQKLTGFILKSLVVR